MDPTTACVLGPPSSSTTTFATALDALGDEGHALRRSRISQEFLKARHTRQSKLPAVLDGIMGSYGDNEEQRRICIIAAGATMADVNEVSLKDKVHQMERFLVVVKAAVEHELGNEVSITDVFGLCVLSFKDKPAPNIVERVMNPPPAEDCPVLLKSFYEKGRLIFIHTRK